MNIRWLNTNNTTFGGTTEALWFTIFKSNSKNHDTITECHGPPNHGVEGRGLIHGEPWRAKDSRAQALETRSPTRRKLTGGEA